MDRNDGADEIFRKAFEEAYLERLQRDVGRFIDACIVDGRVGGSTIQQYGSVLCMFKRFARYGQRRFS